MRVYFHTPALSSTVFLVMACMRTEEEMYTLREMFITPALLEYCF